MNIESLKSSEIPGGIKVVVADDEANVAMRTGQIWKRILQKAASLPAPEILLAANGDDVLAKALGLIDRPADVVVLDDGYSPHTPWIPTEKMLSLLAEKQGVVFEPIRKSGAEGFEAFKKMPDRLYVDPNSVHFALFLRYFKFSGTIIVASSNPPEPQYITQEIELLNKHLSGFGTQIDTHPINGTVIKIGGYFATAYGENDWDYQTIETRDYADTFKALIAAL